VVATKKPDILFWSLVGLLVSVVLAINFYDLTIRPVHHDEGVNGWFINNLINSGKYTYSPEHYHGPTFFYLGRFFSKIFGLSTHTIRSIPAFFSLVLCLSPLFLIRTWNKPAILATGLLLAITPVHLFYARYAIHEMVFVSFFTLAALCLYLYFFKGYEMALYFAAVFLATAMATKETVIISFCAIFVGVSFATFFYKPKQKVESIVGFLRNRGERMLILCGQLFVFFSISAITVYFSFKKFPSKNFPIAFISILLLLFFL